ncbi:hypothetical protein B0H34DRAFT_680019 [Crassisporium funariophilum]|nr:hypothetical protein B0H34DRAFT_680019 [Crassisporium funariophilum]
MAGTRYVVSRHLQRQKKGQDLPKHFDTSGRTIQVTPRHDSDCGASIGRLRRVLALAGKRYVVLGGVATSMWCRGDLKFANTSSHDLTQMLIHRQEPSKYLPSEYLLGVKAFDGSRYDMYDDKKGVRTSSKHFDTLGKDVRVPPGCHSVCRTSIHRLEACTAAKGHQDFMDRLIYRVEPSEYRLGATSFAGSRYVLGNV